jgi:hypothetical protein
MERQSPYDNQRLAALRSGFMDVVVQNTTLGRPRVFFPLPLDMDERPLPLAERHMLESRQWQ